jgi:hypothetical protein
MIPTCILVTTIKYSINFANIRKWSIDLTQRAYIKFCGIQADRQTDRRCYRQSKNQPEHNEVSDRKHGNMAATIHFQRNGWKEFSSEGTGLKDKVEKNKRGTCENEGFQDDMLPVIRILLSSTTKLKGTLKTGKSVFTGARCHSQQQDKLHT